MSSLQQPAAPALPRRLARIDRVVIATALVLAATWALSPAQGQATVLSTATNLWNTAPFLLLSIGIAAWATASGADNLIARVFAGRQAFTIVAAAAFGALSPFCSCGVIPIIAALLSMGVPLAPVMAFWLASPLIDPSMFILTSAVLGPEFALWKLGAAIGIGLFGGFGTLWLQRLGYFAAPLREGGSNGGCAASPVRAPKPVAWLFWRSPGRLDKFRASAVRNALFLGKWLTLAFVLESLMLAYVPAEWVSSTLGGTGVWPIVVATLVGIPAYFNGYAALPLVGGLIGQGMSSGAGMAFLLAGGVTSIPAALAVFALVRRQVFAAYVGFALIGSLLAGLIYQIASGGL